MADKPPSFAVRLRAVREEKGLSQYAVAQRAGVSKQTLSSLESGLNAPNWETVQRLAMALGVDCRSFTDPDLAMPEPTAPKSRGRPAKTAPAEAVKANRKR